MTRRKQALWSIAGATCLMVGALALMAGNWFPWRMAVHNVLWPGVLIGYVLDLGLHSVPPVGLSIVPCSRTPALKQA